MFTAVKKVDTKILKKSKTSFNSLLSSFIISTIAKQLRLQQTCSRITAQNIQLVP